MSAILPDRERVLLLAEGEANTNLLLFHLPTGQVLHTLEVPRGQNDDEPEFVVLPNPKYVAIVGRPCKGASIVEISGSEMKLVGAQYFHGSWHSYSAVHPDGKHLIIVHGEKQGKCYALPQEMTAANAPPSSVNKEATVFQTKDGVLLLRAEEAICESISFVAASADIAIPKCFGRFLPQLKKLELVGLSNLTFIGDDCFAECPSLELAFLADLPKLTHIGSNFLVLCTALKELKLGELPALQNIGARFAAGCTQMKEVALPPLPALIEIGDMFLYGCSNLVAFAAREACGVQKIGAGFAGECPAVKSVDVSAFSSVTEVKGPALFWNSNVVVQDGPLADRIGGTNTNFTAGKYSLDRSHYMEFLMDGTFNEVDDINGGNMWTSTTTLSGQYYVKNDVLHVHITRREIRSEDFQDGDSTFEGYDEDVKLVLQFHPGKVVRDGKTFVLSKT